MYINFSHFLAQAFTFNLLSNKTRRLDGCTQASVVILRSTSYIAIELNVLHLKSYEIQSNRCAQAFLPLIAFLGID